MWSASKSSFALMKISLWIHSSEFWKGEEFSRFIISSPFSYRVALSHFILLLCPTFLRLLLKRMLEIPVIFWEEMMWYQVGVVLGFVYSEVWKFGSMSGKILKGFYHLLVTWRIDCHSKWQWRHLEWQSLPGGCVNCYLVK